MDKHKYAAYCRQAVEEGCVLLENDGTLPFLKNERIAIFGREQFEYVKSGSGSGGKVNCPYVTNLNTCLRSTLPIDGEVDNFYRNFIAENPYNEGDGWIVPSVQKQPVLTDEFVCAAASRCECGRRSTRSAVEVRARLSRPKRESTSVESFLKSFIRIF